MLAIVGVVQSWGAKAPEGAPSIRSAWQWDLTASSCLLYVLAFNLVFLAQEVLLVVPKVFTPGLVPTLFHNNHAWEGEHPLVGLLQGTGASGILVIGLLAALLLRWSSNRTVTMQLFLTWVAYHGIFQALMQVVVGSFNPQNDVGMAMAYFALTDGERFLLAIAALLALAPVAMMLGRHLLGVTNPTGRETTPRGRTRAMFLVATLPAFAAVPLIIPYRVPREWVEVALVPAIVTWLGVAWMQAGAWRLKPARFDGRLEVSVAIPISALIALLVGFQLYLRPGITFR